MYLKKLIYLLLCITFLNSCNEENSSLKKEKDPLSKEETHLANEKELLLLKEHSLNAHEKLRELAIKVNGDYKLLACILKCTPSSLKRIINGESFATKKAEEEIDREYTFLITKKNDVDNYLANCDSKKWTDIIPGVGQPEHISKGDPFLINYNTLWETTNNKDIPNYEEAYNSINNLKQFELENNKKLHDVLLSSSNKYFEELTKKFLEQEYSVMGALSELKAKVSKTPEERYTIWEARLNNYFSSLAYSGHIKREVDSFSIKVNTQRKKIFEEHFNLDIKKSLIIHKVSLDIYSTSKKSVELAVDKSNKNIKDKLKEIAYASVEIIADGETNGAAENISKAVGVIEVVDFVHSFTVPSKDETKKILTNEYTHFLEQNNIDFTELLNKNTNDYYSKLLKLIEKRKNEEILF